MIKKFFGTFIIVLICAGTAGYFYFSGRNYVITIPEHHLQQEFDRNLPIRKNYLYIFDVTIYNPRIDLIKETGRILAGLDVHVDIKIDGVKPIDGSVNASGILKYVPKEGAFYLKSPKVEKMSMRGVEDKHLAQTRSLVEQTLTNYLNKHPVYKLKTNDINHVAAKMALKHVKVEDTKILVHFGL